MGGLQEELEAREARRRWFYRRRRRCQYHDGEDEQVERLMVWPLLMLMSEDLGEKFGDAKDDLADSLINCIGCFSF